MKNIVISLILVLTLVLNVFAAGYSKNYTFTYDLIDCLERLQLAARYSIEDVEYKSILPNLHRQISYLEDAKMFMKKWLKNRNRAIKATAMGMYVDISQIGDACKKLINILDRVTLEDVPEVTEYSTQIGDAWNKIFQTSGLAIWVIAKPAKSKSPKGKIPFIISDEERQELIKYLNKRFTRNFREYEKLLSQKNKGKISEFKLTIPVWSALHLRSLLTQETYEQAEGLKY
jgi:hypothetical protein